MSTFRRGFKSEVDGLVADIRLDFGCRPLDPIDPAALAAHLHIPVVGLTACGADLTERFSSSTLGSRFHAATIPFNAGVAIVHNDLAPVPRQRSNIAHELGHVFLEHELMPVNTEDGIHCDSLVEQEAAWFGFALLITLEAALAIARTRLDVADAAAQFGVSEQAITYRLNASGALARVRRERARRS